MESYLEFAYPAFFCLAIMINHRLRSLICFLTKDFLALFYFFLIKDSLVTFVTVLNLVLTLLLIYKVIFGGRYLQKIKDNHVAYLFSVLILVYQFDSYGLLLSASYLFFGFSVIAKELWSQVFFLVINNSLWFFYAIVFEIPPLIFVCIAVYLSILVKIYKAKRLDNKVAV